jgi:type II secretory pathway pseudopilin PulG
MLTVVAITVIMAGLSVASMVPLRERTAAQQGAELVQQLLQSARKQAVAAGRCYRVDLTDGAGTVVETPDPGTALRLRRYLRAGCDFPAPPGLPQPADADFEATDRTALPGGVSVNVLQPEVLDLLPSGRPKLPASVTEARLLVRYHQGLLRDSFEVVVSPAGAVCIRPAAEPGTCP